MLLVDTYVGASQIAGVGVFAAAPIASGTTIWKLNPDFDRLIPRDKYEATEEPLKSFLDRYAYPSPDDPAFMVYEVDNGRFMNHSEQPNADFSDFGGARAIRDIAAGEEITCNYADFYEDYELMPSQEPDAA